MCYRAGFDSNGVTAAKIIATEELLLSLEFAIDIMPIKPYTGVAFPFMGLLSLDCYHFDFLMILKEMLTFLLLSNLILQYIK